MWHCVVMGQILLKKEGLQSRNIQEISWRWNAFSSEKIMGNKNKEDNKKHMSLLSESDRL